MISNIVGIVNIQRKIKQIQNLRQRLRKHKIKCLPWKYWKGEVDYLPISSKTLFARYGIEIDVLETELRGEGYLQKDEILLEVLKLQSNLYRTPEEEKYFENGNFGLMPADWEEEDFEDYQRHRQK